MMTTDALMWKTWKMSSLPMPYNWRILRRSKTRVTFKYWTQYLIFTTTYKHEELINPHYDHLLSTFFFTDLFLFFIFNICKALFQAHTNCHFFKNTLQWFFLFPIWPWFPSHLTYLVFFPHSVNIGDFSFSCATSPPLGNLTYFHSFNYCNFQNHISYILVASPPILWNFGTTHSSSPHQARLSFWMIQFPGGSTPASHIFQDLCHPTAATHSHDYSLELMINWIYSTVRMTNSGILCFPGGTSGKELIYLMQKTEVMPIPSLDQGSSPEGGHGNPLEYSCLENLHGQRSLVGYSPKGHKE